VRRFWALNWSDRLLVVQVGTLLVLVSIAITILPFSLLRRALTWDSRPRAAVEPPASTDSARPTVNRIAWAVAAVSRRMPRCRCLVQALVGEMLLRRYGHPARLRIGVRDSRGGSQFVHAHAWVECAGTIVIGNVPEMADYKPLSTAGSA
jgi:hypothetical protein